MYEKVKRFFSMGLYTKENVAAFVAKRKLTPEQYKEITGEEYV